MMGVWTAMYGLHSYILLPFYAGGLLLEDGPCGGEGHGGFPDMGYDERHLYAKRVGGIFCFFFSPETKRGC